MRLIGAGNAGTGAQRSAHDPERPAVFTRRTLIVPSLALLAALSFAACGSDDPVSLDIEPTANDQLVHPDTPVGDIGDDPDSNPGAEPADAPRADADSGIEPADGVEPPAEVVTGRVVGVDRDGPSVEVVEATIFTGSDATDAARADGKIGPDETWELDFYVAEGDRRWVDVDPSAVVAVYDCTQACEHVEGTLEQVMTGAPYGGADALWSFAIGEDGRATSVDEIYMP